MVRLIKFVGDLGRQLQSGYRVDLRIGISRIELTPRARFSEPEITAGH